MILTKEYDANQIRALSKAELGQKIPKKSIINVYRGRAIRFNPLR